MIDSPLDNLPILKVFKELKRGDIVYSKEHGLGTIQSLYEKDEIIVQFSSLRKRISVHDNISKVPYSCLQKQPKSKVEVVCDGKAMSFAEFKKRNRAIQRQVKLEQALLKEEKRLSRKGIGHVNF